MNYLSGCRADYVSTDWRRRSLHDFVIAVGKFLLPCGKLLKCYFRKLFRDNNLFLPGLVRNPLPTR